MLTPSILESKVTFSCIIMSPKMG